MSDFKIVPSYLEFKSAPKIASQVSLDLNQTQKELIQWVRNANINLAQLYDDEKQTSFRYRPTFKVDYIYDNTYTGTTEYLPFQYNLYYVEAAQSKLSNIWKGYPQNFEFDFYRPRVMEDHFMYKPQSAYTYNWTYYITYPFENDPNQEMEVFYSGNTVKFLASDGIPFVITQGVEGGANVITFNCFAPHGLNENDYVELSLSYDSQNIFSVLSLGNDSYDSSATVFNILNVGYTGDTFDVGSFGTLKKIVDPENPETKSKYYVRKHKVLANENDIEITKIGFEVNPFRNEKQFEFSSITPNNLNRISQKTSSYSYAITLKNDLILSGVSDNQKREVSEIFLSVVNKGFSGYFNKPFGLSGLKQGWFFNISKESNFWWDDLNTISDSNIPYSSYTQTNGSTETFYYNQVLQTDDVLYGDFCEWNDYYQYERVVSEYIQKLKFNQDIFVTTTTPTTNAPGYYYPVHHSMPIKVFSNYIETGIADQVINVPNSAFYSETDQEFRWREPYSIGEFDNDDRGVNYPYLNNALYPYQYVVFKLIPEGSNYQNILQGYPNVSYQPLIDDCE